MGASRKSLLFSEEKRSKKDFIRLRPLQGEPQTDKSFVVLFFKKEPLAFFYRINPGAVSASSGQIGRLMRV
jgi:hypothetical protein